jgi:carbonic anhydrase
MKALFCLPLFLSLLVPHYTFAEDKNAENSVTPKIALERLMEGNRRFMADKSLCPDRNEDRRTATVAKQKPFAIVLGCSDSRVPPELAFDQGIGDIFVIRVAGNVVGDTELDSVEYSVLHNNSSIIVVLGHHNCGAVTAVMNNDTKDIESIAKLIKPAVNIAHQNIDKAIEENIRHSVKQIQQSPTLAKYFKEGKVAVVGAYYDLESGKISLVE